MGFFKRAGRFLWSGVGAGVTTAALGALTGNGGAVTMGTQMAAGGLVKKASKAAGREVHRIGSPLASLAVLLAAKAAGAEVPMELAAVGAADGGTVATALETLLNGVLPGGLQSATKNSSRAARDYARKRAW